MRKQTLYLSREKTLNSAKEKKKIRRVIEQRKKIDKFCKLRDEIIHYILSILDAKVLV